MKFGVVIFPGSNCDRDIIHVLSEVMQCEVIELWHKDKSLKGLTKNDCIMLPGGFSFGDYLRTGAIARFSPIMESVIQFAQEGGKVWGICNGFQILCEAGLLPGVLLSNESKQFICKNVWLKTTTTNSAITGNLQKGQVLQVPVAHGDGRYYADAATLKSLTVNDQILFQYCNEKGDVRPEDNPNGALMNIAGICNKDRNVFGMMPHPERCAEEALGNIDGRQLFESMLQKVMQAN